VFEVKSKGENFNQLKDLDLNRKVEIHFKIEKIAPPKVVPEESLGTRISKSKKGDKLVLKNLFFYDRTDILYPESYKPREELLKALKDNPKLKIEIHGHICCTPGKDKEEIIIDATRIIQMIQNNQTVAGGQEIDEFLLRQRIERELKYEFKQMQLEHEQKMRLIYRRMIEDMYIDMLNS
jgi:hypothetical protein